MNKNSLTFFALTFVFLSVALVFFFESDLSVGKFLLFFMCGAASGANLIKGITSYRKGK